MFACFYKNPRPKSGIFIILHLKFGIIIRPLNVSERSQVRPPSITAPETIMNSLNGRTDEKDETNGQMYNTDFCTGNRSEIGRKSRNSVNLENPKPKLGGFLLLIFLLLIFQFLLLLQSQACFFSCADDSVRFNLAGLGKRNLS